MTNMKNFRKEMSTVSALRTLNPGAQSIYTRWTKLAEDVEEAIYDEILIAEETGDYTEYNELLEMLRELDPCNELFENTNCSTNMCGAKDWM